MSDSILNYYAKNHASFLHGHGLLATQKMLAQLKLKGHEKVLEIGCGTGASLVFLKNCYPDLELSGGDISPLMYQKAQQRISFAGLSKAISLYLLENPEELPFPDESYDIVWIESVLAILETPLLHQMLLQFNRILKPGGTLVLNESLWLPETTLEEIKSINQQCRKHFGIIQANGDFPTAHHWQSLLEQHGFAVDSKAAFDTLDTTITVPNTFSYQRSRLFNTLGKLKAKLSLQQRNYRKNLRQLEEQIMGKNANKLKAYLFLAKKTSK